MASGPSTAEERQPLDNETRREVENGGHLRYPITAATAQAHMMDAEAVVVNFLNISTIDQQQLDPKEHFERLIRRHYPTKKLLKLCLLLLIVNLNIIILEYEFSEGIKYRIWEDYTFYYGTFTFSKTIVLTCFMNVIYCLLTILSSNHFNFISISILNSFIY
jgi:hypothetical protein